MRTARRLAAATSGLAGLAALAGCGIQPTGVIEAGVPATGVHPQATVRLYFVSATGLQSVTRPASGPVGPRETLDLLLSGPNSAEAARGLTTELAPPVGVAKVVTGTEQVQIVMSTDVSALTPNAVSQLTCTAANAAAKEGEGPAARIDVRITGGRATRGPLRCAVPATPATPAPATTAP
ncbi:hypothetical protein [Streptantibioticus ferralitis]|uniref:GerMN domain-containing protein n=1 Tax=Streptantibioticus ferralitis TaxID=236510 RepID=A0ABT5Z4C0_9ACTN|nr:hypothetical protein [Streptantibioticus ferralitis]MDF2258670.1 hypothetical protein [Streptantibioticus ferralitis]